MRHSKTDLFKQDISDVFVVDLEKNKTLQEDGTEINILPNSLNNWLKADIENLLRVSKQHSGILNSI